MSGIMMRKKCNLWMFLAIASIGLHFYRSLQTINNIPTNSQQDDVPVEQIASNKGLFRDPPKKSMEQEVTVEAEMMKGTETEEHHTVTDTSGKEEVSCGNHRAPSCAECPQGNGAVWCNGECEWTVSEDGGVCQSKTSQHGSNTVDCGGHNFAHTCFQCTNELNNNTDGAVVIFKWWSVFAI